MTTATRTSSLLDTVDQIAPTLREFAPQAEAQRSLSSAAHKAMVDAGLFLMFVPRSLGGLQVDAVSGFEAIEAVSRIDSAAGWNLQIGAAPTGTAALLPETAVRDMFTDRPDTVVAGGFSPPGAVVAVDGGYRLNGRWAWVSGCQHATWIVDPAIQMKDGQPEMSPEGQPIIRVCFYPAAEAEIIDTWNPLGMRGTGSNDVVAKDIFIPEERAPLFRPLSLNPAASFDIAYTRLGMLPVVMGNAVVALGIARAAIDEATEVIRSKTPAHFQVPPGQRSSVHGHLGRAEATLSAAREYFYGALRRGWEVAAAGNVIGVEERKHMQLAASYAADSAARAVDLLHAGVGGNGVLEAQHGLARHFRDVHTITQHALCSATRFESMGQIMLGMETDWAFFHI